MINLLDCQCNDQQPALICFDCWRKGIRHKDKLGEPDGTKVMPVPEIVNIIPIPEKILRYKAAGLLDCTCAQSKANCPKHKEFYGTGRRIKE